MDKFIVGMLGLLFVYLKLTHAINWSWWWVTVPFWGGAAAFLTISFLIILITGTIAILQKK